MIATTRHGKFEKITLLDNYVAMRCVACNLMYLVRRLPARADTIQEAPYLAAQLPDYCPCRFVSATDIHVSTPGRDYNNDLRRLVRKQEGISVIDLTDETED